MTRLPERIGRRYSEPKNTNLAFTEVDTMGSEPVAALLMAVQPPLTLGGNVNIGGEVSIQAPGTPGFSGT